MHMQRIPDAGQELAAVVSSTEGATHDIMAIAENVLAADASNPIAYKEFVAKEMIGAVRDLRVSGSYRPAHRPRRQNARTYRGARVALCQLHGRRRRSRSRERSGSNRRDARKDLMLNGPAREDQANLQPAIDQLLESLDGVRK